MTITLGKTSKDSKYLAKIKSAISGDADHPRNKNLKMQAHHIISAEGMRISGVGKKIEKTGYDINHLNNLAFIPCTLQGACFLGIQPHRGNHNAAVDQDDYIDDMEPETYHDMVGSKVRDFFEPMLKECVGSKKEKANKAVQEIDLLSKKILRLIQHKPEEAPLTRIAKHFGKGGVGCSGVDSVTSHNSTRACPVNRKHGVVPGSSEPTYKEPQKDENILFRPTGKYHLEVKR